MKKQSNNATPQDIWNLLHAIQEDRRKFQAEAEADRKKAEADRKKAEADRKRARAEAEADRKRARAEAEADRKKAHAEAEAERKKAEADRKKAHAEAEAERKKAEAERKKAEAKWEKERQKSEEKFNKQLEEFVNSTDTKINRVEGRWANQWGDLTEALTNKSVVELFQNWGMKVSRTTINYPGRYNGNRREFDILVINGKEIAVLEVKTTLNQKKTDRFLSTMEHFKKYCPEYKNFTIYAGIAYLKARSNILKYAERKGLFLISVGGKTAILINKKQFKPKNF